MSSSVTLHCGPSGWSYPHWNGVVYPRPKPRGFHPLSYLACLFDGVEINTSFYQPLRPEVSRLWVQKVADNPSFLFTAKLNRRFTHERILDETEVSRFKDGILPLRKAGRLGCLLMQFPWSFRFTTENREFFIRLRRGFHEFPLVAEMRHSSWMADEAIGVFIDNRVGFCNIDQPQITKGMPPTAHLTSPIGYVRLHGRDARGWFRGSEETTSQGQRHDYLYPASELVEWKTRIERLRSLASSVFVFANNDGGGKAVVNALQLQAMLGLETRAVPRDLLRAFRRELAGFHADGPVQNQLFAAVA